MKRTCSWVVGLLLVFNLLLPALRSLPVYAADTTDGAAFSEDFSSGTVDQNKWDYLSGVVEVVDDGGNKVAYMNEKDIFGWSRLNEFSYEDNITEISFRVRLNDTLSQDFMVQMRNRVSGIDQTLSLFAISKGEMLFAPWSSQSAVMQTAEVGVWYDIRIVIDARPDVNTNMKMGIYIDDVLKQQMTSIDFTNTSATIALHPDFLKTAVSDVRAPELRFAIQPRDDGVPNTNLDDIDIRNTDQLPEGAPASDVDKVVVELDKTFMYKPGKFTYNIRVDNIRPEQLATYTVETKIVNKETGEEKSYPAYTLNVAKGSDKFETKTITDITQKCVYEATWTVKHDGQAVDSTSSTFAVMTPYEEQFMDRYTPFAINAGMDKVEDDIRYQRLDILKNMGFNSIRMGMTWGNSEQKKGEIDLNKLDAMMKPVLEYDMQPLYLLSYNNVNYFTRNDGSTSANWGPQSKENIDGFINYATTIVERYPQIQLFEIWNEPDHQGFWGHTPDPIELANLMELTTMKLKQVRPDATYITNTIGKNHDKDFTFDYFDLGVLSYVDAYSDHLYEHGTGPTPELFAERLRDHARSTVDSAGAWKDIYQTETGFTMVEGAMGVTEQGQAEYLVKRLLATALEGHKQVYMYAMVDAGTDPYNKEHCFGILWNDHSPKLAVVSLRQMMGRLQGALYIGKISDGDGTGTYVYSREGKPVAVTWTNTDVTRKDTFTTPVTIEDQYGNVVATTSEYEFDTKPHYILGMDNSYFAKAAGDTMSTEWQAWLDKWYGEGMAAAELTDVVQAAQSHKAWAAAMMESGEMPTQEALTEQLTGIYDLGKQLIAAYGDGTLGMEENQAMVMLYELYQLSGRYANLLTVVEEPEKAYEMQSDEKIAAVQKVIDTKNANQGKMRFTEDILAQAENYNEIAHGVAKEKSDAAPKVMQAYDFFAALVADWSEAMCAVEQPDMTHSVIIQAEPTRMEFYGSAEEKDVRISVTNYNPERFKGYLAIYDDNDQLIGEKRYISIKDGKSKTYDMPVHYTGDKVEDSTNYTIKILQMDGETVFKEEVLPITVRSQFQVSMLPSANETADIKRVTLKVTEVGGAAFEGSVKLTPPDGWSLTTGTMPLSIETGSPGEVTFAVSQTKQVPFNQYVFHAEIYNDQGVRLYNQNVALDFSLVVKADEMAAPADFDGDISSWANAYPVFIGAPSDPASLDDWKASNVAAKAYAKWDDNYFYALVDVFDDVHHVLTKGTDSWNGDSVQLSFDTLNTNSEASYDGDDYEITFSLHSAGEQVYAHTAATPKEFGDRPAEWLKVYRDDDKKTTRYYIRIPKDELAPLSLTQNNVFGLNVAVNDGDLVNRDRFIELTPGTASKKNPVVYYDWKMIGDAVGADPAQAEGIVDLKINQKIVDGGVEIPME